VNYSTTEQATQSMEVVTGKELPGHVLLQFVWVKILARMKKAFPLLQLLLALLHNTQAYQAIMPGTQWKQKHPTV